MAFVDCMTKSCHYHTNKSYSCEYGQYGSDSPSDYVAIIGGKCNRYKENNKIKLFTNPSVYGQYGEEDVLCKINELIVAVNKLMEDKNSVD